MEFRLHLKLRASHVVLLAFVGGALVALLGLYFFQLANPTERIVSVQVDARQTWQATGLTVRQGSHVTIQVVGGQWTEWKGTVAYNPGTGSGYLCSATLCDEPLPRYAKGALIARIGEQALGVGSRSALNASTDGSIWLRMNDTDAGLSDNDGFLTVQISVH